MPGTVSLFWLRRDLRLHDNAALSHALQGGHAVQAVFIFDKNILAELGDPQDRRVQFIHRQLQHLQKQLQHYSATLDVRYGKPVDIFQELLNDYEVKAVFANRDYEPYARERDAAIEEILSSRQIPFHTYKDQVVFEKDEIVKDDGRPYTVFTPYNRKWKSRLNDAAIQSYPAENFFNSFYRQKAKEIPALASMGFIDSNETFPTPEWSANTIQQYKALRDFPAEEGTTRLSVHLRFGTLSIRQLVRETKELSESFLNELIWREFYQMILWHFPQVVSQSFKPEYDKITWRNNEAEFKAWYEGKTGYPIVDAGMRELNSTGFMHNRVRMIVASFLTKHLLVDWRWGEAYFASKLLDYDLASNNGGWQWAAGSGADAAPYFRIFNPSIQTKKFDPQLKYIRKWVPEFDTPVYPHPIVDHQLARERCLQAYSVVRK